MATDIDLIKVLRETTDALEKSFAATQISEEGLRQGQPQKRHDPYEPCDAVKKFMADAVGYVEATRYEYSSLWLSNRNEGKLEWRETLSGFMVTVAHLHDRPICISLRRAVIDGHVILFVEATSQLVDWGLIEAWLKKNLPASAMRGSYPNHTDATNFHNIFPR